MSIRRLDAIGEALYASAQEALEGHRKVPEPQVLYSTLMRILEHARREAIPAYDRVHDIKLICEAALGVDGPPVRREERDKDDHSGVLR